MSRIARFAEYAAAFEKAYASDDWSLLEPYFTEDAVYDAGLGEPLGGVHAGRAAVLAHFRDVVSRFDRRFGSRSLALLEGPRDEGDSVWIRGRATYGARGLPDFELELEERALFRGDRIARLEDRYAPAKEAEMKAYLAEHGAKLGIEALA
jgi:hypothetical protein